MVAVRANDSHQTGRPIDQTGTTRSNADGTRQPRLTKILIFKAASVIWALRCERIIRGTVYTKRESVARWRRILNRSLSEDTMIIATRVLRKNYIKLIITPGDKSMAKRRNTRQVVKLRKGFLVGTNYKVTPLQSESTLPPRGRPQSIFNPLFLEPPWGHICALSKAVR
ncbi:hypothetical protein EI94DRAFT_936902 [Lactarius quietus]|nr:hypothetical protein EI94DRAFT_948561 [Lactarius quietus]KAF8260113.1 hypothetical protein EI94DRAFT_936902 [Lactarius quietus]